MSKKTSIICMGLAALLCVAGMTQMYRMMTTENSVSAEEVESVDVEEEPQDLTSHCIPDDYDLNYRIHGDTAEVYKMVYTMASPEEVVVADTYDGLPVTSIAEETFTGFALVKYFSLPDSIEKIGSFAFYKCNSLQEIDLPKNLKTIDEAAFLECNSLKTVYLYDDLESIGNSCFDFSLKDVYYSGTEEQWNAIKIGEENTHLEKATIHFNADSADPTEEATVRSYYDGNSDNNSLVSLNVTGDVNEDGTVDIVDVLALNQY
ncbi:MAG: leucine-rich repeat protein, partial [Oscillospiraceae bacterium]